MSATESIAQDNKNDGATYPFKLMGHKTCHLIIGTADTNLGLTAATISELKLQEVGTVVTRFGYTTKAYQAVNVEFTAQGTFCDKNCLIAAVPVYLLDITKLGGNSCVWGTLHETGVIAHKLVAKQVKYIVLENKKTQLIVD
jgi:hypothetical protein